jgi:uncharacterized protein (DUF983 family)
MTRPVIVRATKTCNECGENKALSEFDKDKGKCKECRSFLNSEYYRNKRNRAKLQVDINCDAILKALNQKLNI